ncbi:MAG: hypothetical protein QW403_03325, partial [Candidatus Aenigmatarchaeota archaeon]
AFYLADDPFLESPDVFSNLWRWGTVYTFTTRLYDYDYDNKTVYLWISRDGVSWRLINQTTFVGPTPSDGQPISLNYIPNCDDVGNWYFKFNVSDTSGYRYEVSGYQFSVEKRLVAISPLSGVNEIINREYDVKTLAVNVIDILNGSSLGNIKVRFVTINKSNEKVYYPTLTNSSGIARFDFNPDCSYNASSSYWYAEVYGEDCYEDAFSSNFDILILGQLKSQIIYPEKNSEFPTGILINVNTSIYSDCSDEGRISGASLNIKITDPYNTTYNCYPISENSGFYNCTFDTSFKKPGYYVIKLNASKENYDYNYTEYSDWFKILNSPPTYSSLNVTPEESYWTDTFNFSVYVSDSDYDDVNCSLEIKEKGSEIWNYVNSTLIQGSGLCSFVIKNFGCDDIGSREFRFVLFDGSNDPVITTSNQFNLTKSLINVSLYSGSGISINRNTGFSYLGVVIYDLIRNKQIGYQNGMPESKVTFNVTKDGSNYIILTPEPQDTMNGIAQVLLTPDCTYTTGIQYWKGYVVSDSCYDDAFSSEFNFTVIGSLTPRVVEPTGGIKYLKGSNISIISNISDDCENLVDPDIFNISVISSTGISYTCEVERMSLGYYNCTFESSGKPAGYYSIRLNATKLFHGTSIYTETNAFWIETLPSLINLGTNRPNDKGGWGEPWGFRVNVTDEDKDLVNVYAWYRQKGVENWQLLGTGQKPQGSVSSIISISPSPAFSCSHLLGLTEAEYEFFFNASDDDSNIATSEVRNFTLERDDIQVSISQGDGAIYNRSSTAKVSLGINVQDRDRNSGANQPYNATLLVTYNGYTFTQDQVRTSSSSSLTFSFPNISKCIYQVGPQLWKVNVDSICYKPATSSIANLNITTLPLNLSLVYPVNKVFDINDQIPVIINVRDDCGFVPYASVSISIKNQDGNEYSCSQVTDHLNGTYSCIFSNLEMGYYTVLANASKQYYPEGEFVKENAFLVATYPSILNARAYSSKGENFGGWGDTWSFEIEVKDEDQLKFDFERLNISLYINFTGNYELINSTICYAPECNQSTIKILTSTFDCSKIGTKNFKFVVTDYFNNSQEIEGTIIIQPDEARLNVTEYPLTINREGYESKGFVFRIYDEDKKIYPSNVNVSLKFTTDGINFNYVVYELSDSDGNVSYYLDPDCSFTAGTQYFKAETSDICYQFAETENYNFDIIGSLRNSIIYPEKGSEILIEYGELINVSALVEDECENKISEATVSLKAIWPNNTQETLTLLSSQNGIYNFTLDLTSKIGGNYSFSVESSKEYYNSNSTLFENWIFLINSPPIAENVSVAPESGGWGEKFSFRVDVYDLQRDTINCSLYVYTGKNDWLLKGSKIIQNGQGTCEINVTNFDCLDINTTQPTRFKFQISDGENVFNTSEILAPSIGRNDVNLTLIRGNNSFVNRTYGSTLFTIRVFDLDRSIYPENVNLSVLATKDNYNYQRIGYVLSNSTGYANFNFAPDCSYNVGIQNWKFEVVDNCYIPLNSSDYITTIYGWLRNNITSPKGEKYLRGEQDVILRGQIKDECGNEISQANATFKVRNVNGATFTCSPTQEEDFGYYNCTIYSQTHSTWPTRGYDVTMESNKTYYNINSTTQQFMQGVRGFFLETRPRIWNPQAIPSQDGGWGETWSFKVRVGDYDFDNLVVRMWLRKAGQDWSLAAANYSVQGEDVEVVFTKSDFTSLDIGNWEVKFNVTDYPNVDSWDKNETLPISFTLVQDDINITLIEGNDTVVNRSIAPLQSNATFSIRIYDTDKNELIGVGVPINAKFYVSNDSSWTSFILDSSVSSIQAGQFVNTTFPTQPRCRYDIGLLRWYAEAGGSGTAYKLTNSTSFYGYFYVTTVTYPLQAQVLAPDNKTYRRAVDSITYIGNVSDD